MSDSGSSNQQWPQVTDGSCVRFRNRATGLYLDGMGRTGNADDLGQRGDSASTTSIGRPSPSDHREAS